MVVKTQAHDYRQTRAQITATGAKTRASTPGLPKKQGLYDPRNERDACGVGFVAHLKGKKSHQIVKDGLFMLENLTHRGAVGADPLMGDGAGVLVQVPDAFFRREMAAQGVELPPTGQYGVGHWFMPRDAELRAHIDEIIREYQLPAHTVALGVKGCITWSTTPVRNYRDYKATDFGVAELSWLWGVNRGILTPPGLDEQWLVSLAHTQEEMDVLVSDFRELAQALRA